MEQSPEPLAPAFLSGVFNGPEKGWSIPEKEAYAVVAAVDKLDYLLLRQKGFVLLTDHRNLEFNPANFAGGRGKFVLAPAHAKNLVLKARTRVYYALMER